MIVGRELEAVDLEEAGEVLAPGGLVEVLERRPALGRRGDGVVIAGVHDHVGGGEAIDGVERGELRGRVEEGARPEVAAGEEAARRLEAERRVALEARAADVAGQRRRAARAVDDELEREVLGEAGEDLVGLDVADVDQAVDHLTARVETNLAGSFLWIDYEDHIYERNWAYDELAKESATEATVIPGDDMTDSKGVIICRRTETSIGAACSVALTTHYRAEDGDGALVASYESKLALAGDKVVVSGSTLGGGAKYGKPDDVWIELLLLADGEYPLAQLSTVAPR